MFMSPRVRSSRILNSTRSLSRQTLNNKLNSNLLVNPRGRITMNATRSMATLASGEEKVKTLSNQNKLPRLPVPDLDKSLQGYLKSVIPVLEQKVSRKDDLAQGSRLTTVWSK